MTGSDLVTLIDSAERQLNLAVKVASEGGEVDLAGLAAWLDRICTTALEQRAAYAAPGLAILMARLDTLGTLLRGRLTELSRRKTGVDNAGSAVGGRTS